MGARDNVQAALDEFCKKAEKRKPPKKRLTPGAPKSYIIICAECVRLGRDVTTHIVKSPKAKYCKSHKGSVHEREWRAKNPERHKARTANYRKKHRARINQQSRLSYEKCKDRARFTQAVYYSKNREKLMTEMRLYYKKWLVPWRERGVSPAPDYIPVEVF